MKKDKCPFCGRKGRRECPAQNAVICSECCGIKRISDISCSPECSYNIFGLHAIEAFRTVDKKFSNIILLSCMLEKGFLSQEEIQKLRADIPEDESFFAAMYSLKMMRLFRDKQSNDRTTFEIWQSDGFDGLTHDEACMLGFKKNAMPTIIEFQRNIDCNFVECIDLFAPEREVFLLLDPMIVSAGYPRYTRALCWLEHYPSFARLGCGGQILSALTAEEFIETAKKMATEENFASTEFPEKECILANFDYFWNLPTKINDEKRKAILSTIDIKVCNALYDISGNHQEILEILRSKPDFQENPEDAKPGEHYFIWRRCGESKKIEKKMFAIFRHDESDGQYGIVGNLILRQDSLLIEARTEQLFTFAMKMAKSFFGDLITLREKAVRDLAKEMAAGDFEFAPESKKTPDDIPVAIKQKIFHDYMEKHYRKLIDEKIPKLDGMTPRQASRKPEMREALLNLMKGHIHMNEINAKEQGITPISLDWLLDELGLEELKQ